MNTNDIKNPQKIRFLVANMAAEAGLPGVGPDLVYRDPWGNPYIISLDLNYDQKCRDAFYRLQAVSQQNGLSGHYGLFHPAGPGGVGNNFEFNGGVMVWSIGPDKKADPEGKANEAFNRDNVLSWRN